MGLSSSSFRGIVFGLLCLCIAVLVIQAFGTTTNCQKNKTQADLRSVVIGAVTRYSYGPREYESESLQTMSDFLYGIAEVDLWDASLMFSRDDRTYIQTPLPMVVAYRDANDELIFDERVLNYPIGFSIAVYSDWRRSASMTPILWTRDLERYQKFDKVYGGYVAFLDGHVEYFSGRPGKPAPRLEALFGPEGELRHALRVLRHVPEDFEALGLDPLPVRFHKAHTKPDWHRGRLELVALSSGLLAGLVAMLATKKRGWGRLLTAGLVLVAVEVAVFLLIAIQIW